MIFSVTARIIMLFNVDAVSYRMYTNYTWKVNHARLQFLSSRTPLIFAQQTTILCVSNIELFIWKMLVNPHARTRILGYFHFSFSRSLFFSCCFPFAIFDFNKPNRQHFCSAIQPVTTRLTSIEP